MTGHSPSIYERFVKRALDILLSVVALVVLSPILVVTAVLVRVKLGSPILFKQIRPGRRNSETGEEELFKLFKFRTMTDRRDEEGNLLPDSQRLTPFGKALRSTSIDELPELINILKGDMSLVGPRPLATVYLPYYTPEEHHRHDVRPGLTGLAQVMGRNSISWEEKFSYDLEYVDELSLKTDLLIIIQTVIVVLRRSDIGQGENHPGSLHEIRSNAVGGTKSRD